jgi:nucleotide-binding universal stress UspA family protein
MLKKILVAIDDSAPSVRAVDVATDLVRQLTAEVALLHVVDPALAFTPDLSVIQPGLLQELHAHGEALLLRAQSRLPHALAVQRFRVEGEPAEEIMRTAEEWEADLIVIGSDSRGRLAHFLLGSTADSVIRRASCPVLTVRVQAVTISAAAEARNSVAAVAVAS